MRSEHANTRGSTARLPLVADLGAAAGAAVLAAVAFLALDAGHPLRLVLGLSMLLFVPGFLLLEACLGAGAAAGRWTRVGAAVGLSPPLVGLLALSTALVPGGFRPLPIVLLVTAACVACAGVAALRRLRHRDSVLEPVHVSASA